MCVGVHAWVFVCLTGTLSPWTFSLQPFDFSMVPVREKKRGNTCCGGALAHASRMLPLMLTSFRCFVDFRCRCRQGRSKVAVAWFCLLHVWLQFVFGLTLWCLLYFVFSYFCTNVDFSPVDYVLVVNLYDWMRNFLLCHCRRSDSWRLEEKHTQID